MKPLSKHSWDSQCWFHKQSGQYSFPQHSSHRIPFICHTISIFRGIRAVVGADSLTSSLMTCIYLVFLLVVMYHVQYSLQYIECTMDHQPPGYFGVKNVNAVDYWIEHLLKSQKPLKRA
jgi:hypothetical protein